MEAASARYAARDRFGHVFGDAAQTPLQRYIQNAVDPSNFEPNLALDLEIADLVNTKKGSAPREAAVAIVKYINHRNPNVSMLALTLLDICVKNCGYPFQLQISTKEFLNELVRRFPERPPVRPTRVHNRILEILEEWRQTICQTSKYKDDLGYIRDMHRLLHYKGYMFPEIRREDAAVLNPSDNLQSAEEMEEEERNAQSAKLQELIRRGGPEDLQEANRLMKIMAGYDQRNKVDYRAKAADEVGKIQQKARLLEERLQNVKVGEKIDDGDVFEDLANSLLSAQPKIQKMCEEESDDQEAVAKLFEINDSIHRTIERYKLIKKGDVEGAQKIPQGTLGKSVGVGKGANQELSLIDFEGEADAVQMEPAAEQGTSQAKPVESLQDDLLGLSFNDSSTPYGQGGMIALGLGTPQNTFNPPQYSGQASSSSLPQSMGSPQPASGFQQTSQSSFDPFQAFNTQTSQPSSQRATPVPFASQQKSSQPPAPPQPQSDPFQQFSSSTPQPSKASATHSGSLVDLGGLGSSPPSNQPSAGSNAAGADDDFTFSSALPDEGPPTSNTVQFSQNEIGFSFDVSRRENVDSVVDVSAKFSNLSTAPITDFTFQVAVTKAYSLKLTPQSGRKLQANERNGITQPMEIHGVVRGQVDKVKVRWKATYKVAGSDCSLQGELPPLGIA